MKNKTPRKPRIVSLRRDPRYRGSSRTSGAGKPYLLILSDGSRYEFNAVSRWWAMGRAEYILAHHAPPVGE